MIISFIGGGSRVEKCAQLFINKAGFEIGGFYCNPINDCADIAITTNTKLFSCIDDLCTASDAVFIATEDDMLPAVIHTITRLHIHNKIIISCAKNTYGSHLDNGYDNTNIIIDSVVPFEFMTDAELNDAFIAVNGVGTKLTEFASVLEKANINHRLLTTSELDLFRAACHIVHCGIDASVKAGCKLLKIATDCDDISATPIIKNAIKQTLANSPTIYTEGDVSQVEEICNTFEELGIASITNIYKANATFLTENAGLEKEIAEDMANTLRS